MMNTLTQKPSAHPVMEWVFAALVPSLYQVAQKTGLLEECAKGNSQIDSLAAHLSLSERGVSALVRCLFAAGILVRDDRGSTSVLHDKIEYYINQFNAVEALVRSLQQGIFDTIKEDG